ncbi:hypothetical protein J3Q07_08175 [Pseudomonas sp. D4-18]|uniref:hypothetical protein n=1 Tax=Pseudomonas sp. D4-18 TaxID=2817395 RepID=UPI003DA842D7
MISLELSSIQQKDTDRAWLAQAMDGYLAQGRFIDVIPTSRSLFNPGPFNSEVIAPSAASEKSPAQRNFAIRAAREAKKKAYEAGIAKKLAGYYEKGVVAAAKELHITTRRANMIAEAYGITFASRGSAASLKAELVLVPEIRRLMLEGLTQDQMSTKLGISRMTLRRIARQNGLRFRCASARAKDVALVERIKAIRDIGCTRAACARKLEINAKVLLRLIAEYKIDFPVQGEAREAA